ncbi:MAG: biotin--[acetyl-CoA-carboxylase] ligase [Gemmatimonadota bacterium]
MPRVEVFHETESTLDVAHAMATRGAESGTLVVADRQTAGRGRMGRTWSSAPGAGVWCTVIERPSDTAALDVLSIRVGLGIAEALDAIAGERVGLKWPNDLIVAAGKLGGILIETRWSGEAINWVAVGVGVNVVAPANVPGAAGLIAAPGSRVAVLAAIVGAVRAAAARIGHLSPDEEARYAARDALRGKQIAEPAAGTVAGIAPTGELLVTQPNRIARVRSGTIRLAEDS